MIETILLVIALIWIVRLEIITNAHGKQIDELAIIANEELTEIRENIGLEEKDLALDEI